MAEGGCKTMPDEADKDFRYTSKKFISTFFTTIHQFRLDDVFCDIQLQVGKEMFSCHKIILMAGSSYFHAMFISGMTELDKGVINIRGVSPQIFSTLLDFLYSGSVSVTEDNCEDLLMAADMLSVSEVVTACCTFLKDKLQPENCIGNDVLKALVYILARITASHDFQQGTTTMLESTISEGIYLFADTISNSVLKADAENFIHRNFIKVAKEEEYYSVDKDHLISLLSSENLHVENEYQVFKAAIDWIHQSPSDRKKHIFDLMAPIRFPIISEKQIDKYIENLQDSDLSIKISLQKIVADFRVEKKGLSIFDRRKKTAVNEPYLFVPRKCARKNIYICGGFTRPKGGRWSDARTLNTVERYDTFYHTWHECPSLQYHRSTLGAGAVNGQVCVAGGENDMLILDSVEMYDPVTYEWTSLPGMLHPRCGLGVCALDGCLYALGGWVGSEMNSCVERYNPEARSWEVVGHCRQLKCWMGITAENGLVYVAGGCNDLSEELCSVESFNPVTKEWTTLPDLNTRRSYPGVAVLDDCLYAVGGWNEGEGALKSVEKLCFETGRWVEVAPMSEARAAASVVVVNNSLYVLGGRSYNNEFTAPSTLDTVETYDPARDVWSSGGVMLSSRCEAAAVVI